MINAFLDMFYRYQFELTWLGIGIILLAWMDFIMFQRPHDCGYFSLHTKGSKHDAWHDAKKLAIFCFGIAAIGEMEVLRLINNPYVTLAVMAFILQIFVYNGILKTIAKIIRKKIRR